MFMDNQASVDQQRLQSQKQKQTERMKRFSVSEHNTHFKQETQTFCAEIRSFPREGCIWLSLEGGRKFKSVTDLQTSVLVRHIELDHTSSHKATGVPWTRTRYMQV